LVSPRESRAAVRDLLIYPSRLPQEGHELNANPSGTGIGKPSNPFSGSRKVCGDASTSLTTFASQQGAGCGWPVQTTLWHV